MGLELPRRASDLVSGLVLHLCQRGGGLRRLPRREEDFPDHQGAQAMRIRVSLAHGHERVRGESAEMRVFGSLRRGGKAHSQPAEGNDGYGGGQNFDFHQGAPLTSQFALRSEIRPPTSCEGHGRDSPHAGDPGDSHPQPIRHGGVPRVGKGIDHQIRPTQPRQVLRGPNPWRKDQAARIQSSLFGPSAPGRRAEESPVRPSRFLPRDPGSAPSSNRRDACRDDYAPAARAAWPSAPPEAALHGPATIPVAREPPQGGA